MYIIVAPRQSHLVRTKGNLATLRFPVVSVDYLDIYLPFNRSQASAHTNRHRFWLQPKNVHQVVSDGRSTGTDFIMIPRIDESQDLTQFFVSVIQDFIYLMDKVVRFSLQVCIIQFQPNLYLCAAVRQKEVL